MKPVLDYFSATGRMNRKPYLLNYILLPSIIVFPIMGLGFLTQSKVFGWLYILTSAVFYVASISACIRRLHDRDRSGWFYLVIFVPLVGLWPAVEIIFLRGTNGVNRFGPDPLGNQLTQEVHSANAATA